MNLKRETRWRNVAIAFGILLINLGLNATLFLPGEMPYRDSIEAGYASMARFFAAHPDPWGWNPTQYCGLPAQFTYLPGLHYLTALLARLAPLEPDHAWRLLGAAFACLGPVAVFVFVLYFTKSRWSALASALVYTFFSPLYGWAHAINWDRGQAQIPWRLQVMVKYGEAPHLAGLAMLPLALIAVWVAATGRKYRQILLTALLLTAIALTNWVAALALAVCCLLLMLAGLGAENFRPLRVFAAAALAYGLACFWLTPSFIRTVAFNWPTDAFAYK
ncbi:MAG: hypothetical protein AAB225_14070, partial [Acidobacteriota bacterium]